MLEVDEDSRLGREVMAGGTRYHAHFTPDEDTTADFYVTACEQLEAAGIVQYEISNFARVGFESRHNLKYWTRQPYIAFGVDAHSMLVSADAESESVRFSAADVLERYIAGVPLQRMLVSQRSALEESFFLGLRLSRGVNLRELAAEFGDAAVSTFRDAIAECEENGLMRREDDVVRLTKRGRLLSNEVFEKFIALGEAAG
jgi:oxygen-independent coproporphyrinogen-3 oxidase